MIGETRRNLKLRSVWILSSFVFFWQIQAALPAEVGTGAKPADTEADLETTAAKGLAKSEKDNPVHGVGAPAPGSLEKLEQLVVKQSQEIEALRQLLRQQSERINQLERKGATAVPASFNTSSGTGVTANGYAAASTPAPSSANNATAGPQRASPAASDNVPASSTSAGVTGVVRLVQPLAMADATAGTQAAAQPAKQERKPDSIELANGKIKIGTVLFADYAYYTKTGFGPQFLTQINQPGPGNNSYNTFEISRAYINLFYSPNDAVTFRLTPNLYRQIGAAPATRVGRTGAIGANTDQELSYRIKYAYVDFNTLFARSEAFKKDKLTIGTQQNPFVDWEENLYGYRWTSLVPWNYLSLSSAQTGIKLQGPIESNGKQYLDYSIGVFTNASFRQLEQSEKKQFMARLTAYPFGAKSNFDGLGFTGFYNYGYRNVTPDTATFPLYRVAALVHYTFKENAYGIAGEFDLGRNAFNSGNFFSGSGPQDEFGVAPTGGTQYARWDGLVQALQNGNGTKQRGYAAFGHAQISGTPFTLFAMYHYFLPNTQVDKNPFDFHRIIGGVSYKVNDRLRFGLTSQNLIFRHSQFTFPASALARFSPSLAAANPNGIPNAVPNRVQAIFANVEFNF